MDGTIFVGDDFELLELLELLDFVLPLALALAFPLSPFPLFVYTVAEALVSGFKHMIGIVLV